MPDQLSLFAHKVTQPAGFGIEPDLVSAEEERALIARIGELPLTPFQFGAFEGRRRVASFGWRYDYSMQKLQLVNPVPDWLIPLALRIEAFSGFPMERFSRFFARNMMKVWGSAGIGTNHISMRSSDCPSPPPASSVSAARSTCLAAFDL
jgi:hypothetical protein